MSNFVSLYSIHIPNASRTNKFRASVLTMLYVLHILIMSTERTRRRDPNPETRPMASAIMSKKKTKKATGFVLQCPACGGVRAPITLDLIALAPCQCEACGDSFAAPTAIKLLTDRLTQGPKVVRWIEVARH